MVAEKTRLNIELDANDLKLFNELKEKSGSKTNKAAFLYCLKLGRYMLTNKLKKQTEDGTLVDIEILT